IRDIIHTVKGTSANIGAEKLFLTSKKILENNSEISESELELFISELKFVGNSIINFLKQEEKIIDSSSQPRLDLKNEKDACNKELTYLLNLLKNFNAEALPVFNEIIKKYDLKKYEYEFQSLQRLIFSYSFEECAVLVERLIEKINL
nr:hypothetical protein [Candidatus Dependentiae bacterium]